MVPSRRLRLAKNQSLGRPTPNDFTAPEPSNPLSDSSAASHSNAGSCASTTLRDGGSSCIDIVMRQNKTSMLPMPTFLVL